MLQGRWVVRIRLILDGREHVVDYDELTRVTIGELRTIKRETGMTLPALHARLLGLKDSGPGDDNIDLYAAMVYLVLCRAGEQVSWADVERIPLVDLAAGLTVEADPAATRVDVDG